MQFGISLYSVLVKGEYSYLIYLRIFLKKGIILSYLTFYVKNAYKLCFLFIT